MGHRASFRICCGNAGYLVLDCRLNLTTAIDPWRFGLVHGRFTTRHAFLSACWSESPLRSISATQSRDLQLLCCRSPLLCPAADLLSAPKARTNCAYAGVVRNRGNDHKGSDYVLVPCTAVLHLHFDCRWATRQRLRSDSKSCSMPTPW